MAFEFDAELQDAAERLGLHLDDAFEREDEADVEEDLFASAVADAQAAVCQALRVLDDKGVFGRGEARPLLNLWFGDQSDDAFVQLASTLNPPDVVQRFQAELVQRAKLFGDERA